MCIAVPSKIVSMGQQMAVVEVEGVRRETSLLLVPEASVGDWVIVHAGFAIQILDESAAKESLALLREAVGLAGQVTEKHKA